MQPGDRISQYEIERELGRGGMGTVYAVRHRVLDKRFALKILHQEFSQEKAGRDRFRREAKVMARLRHPNVLPVDEFGEGEGRDEDHVLWLRMPLIEGNPWITLEERMKAEGRLSESDVAVILSQILAGLTYAHGMGVIHRDIKPANILLAPDGVKIADFGIVEVGGADWMQTRVAETARQSRLQLGDGGTLPGKPSGPSTNSLAGTWAYLAPELRNGEIATVQSDLYAAGLIGFQMLTGHESPGFDPPSKLVAGISIRWDNWMRTALAGAGTRFQIAQQMADATPVPNSPRRGHHIQVWNQTREIIERNQTAVTSWMQCEFVQFLSRTNKRIKCAGRGLSSFICRTSTQVSNRAQSAIKRGKKRFLLVEHTSNDQTGIVLPSRLSIRAGDSDAASSLESAARVALGDNGIR